MPKVNANQRTIPEQVTDNAQDVDSEEGTYQGWKAFTFHGMEFKEIGGQGHTDCPFCGKRKFYVSQEEGLWQCKVCGLKGNPVEFLRQLHDASFKTTSEEHYLELMEERGLLTLDALYEWGVCRSVLTNEWLVPGYYKDGKLGNLYRWAELASGKRRLLSTSGFHHQLMGLGSWDSRKPNVYVCEGPFDGMALWEALRSAKQATEGSTAGGYEFTANPALSLLSSANVIAAPGANVWHEGWGTLFGGKRLFFLYDNDHPTKNPQGHIQPPGAWVGMRRACELLACAEQPPSTIHVMCWDDGDGRAEMGDHCPGLPHGTDVRDWMVAGECSDLAGRVELLSTILPQLQLIPDEWTKGHGKGRAKGTVEILPMACNKWSVLVNQWRKAMKWFPGLDRALSFMLACASSTDIPGEQLWGKVVGPPSTGKSTLCEALSVCKKHIVAKSTMRGFHSGYKTDRDGEEDNSLLATLRGKTLITKDGDTLLQAPNLGQILSEARDIYDRVSRTHYRNKTSRDYEQLNMTWLLCGTSSLRALDSSELGQRFLDCVIMDEVSTDHERDINRRSVNQVRNMMSGLATLNGSAATHEDKDMLLAKRMTGGYLEWLRSNINELCARTELGDQAADSCLTYGTFVAMMRARPSKRQDEEESREMSTRLVKQFLKLAYCTAAVLNKDVVDNEVLARLQSVACDTARGKTMNLCKWLYDQGQAVGGELKGVEVVLNVETNDAKKLGRFLRTIGAVEQFKPEGVPGFKAGNRWRLTPHMRSLYAGTVLGELPPVVDE